MKSNRQMITGEDRRLLVAREFDVSEIARIFGMPLKNYDHRAKLRQLLNLEMG